ncbi:MAG TPA: (d)CMP kinase [Cyanobacteria bacterium UBA8530]|nr:(d)CMP kinase [Cyanobacteria bacterium UBA8530]
MKKGLIIAIDGPAGAGKSTVAKLVAKMLGYLYLDTGAMYRALTWKAMQHQLDWQNEEQLAALAKKTELKLENSAEGTNVWVDGQDVTSFIRSPEVNRRVSALAKSPPVREVLVALQRRLGEEGAVVMEGRDIGSIVFPKAEVKVFLNASPAERARRRLKDLEAQGVKTSLEELSEEIRQRDWTDSTRSVSPLKKANDAIDLDSDGLSAEQIAEKIAAISRERGA